MNVKFLVCSLRQPGIRGKVNTVSQGKQVVHPGCALEKGVLPMAPTIMTLVLALAVPSPADDSGTTPRQPNPLAPSLPLLTDKEEAHLDKIIDRFIDADIGRIRGEAGQQAVREFKTLGPEAIPALIRGVNRAALIDGSCPAVTIARKLASLLRASNDLELLLYARENIGMGVTQSRHMSVLRDLRFTCLLRQRTVAQNPPDYHPVPVTPRIFQASTLELLKQAAAADSSDRREQVLKEIERRTTNQLLADLAPVAADTSAEGLQELARDLMDRSLARVGPKTLKEKLKDKRAEVRAAAARAIAVKELHLEDDLISLLSDEDPVVSQSARQALTKLAGGRDFGPEPAATDKDRAISVRRWKAWLAPRDDR
jgi:hypothetical protein